MDKITSDQFFNTWIETVNENKEKLEQIWHAWTDYTYFIKGSQNSILEIVARKIGLLCYEQDYYSLDAVLYTQEDLVPGTPENSCWLHYIRVAFEHENNFSSGLFKEVSHLLITNCDLKVLVTYPNRDIEQELSYLHQIISASTQQAQSISDDENFLIIFGYGDKFQWTGYVYKSSGWKEIKQTYILTH